MAGERRNMAEQERSIQDRKEELFLEVPAVAPSKQVRPFPEYLRETPAVPLSAAVKGIFWVVGVVVILLFLAALWRVQRAPAEPGPKPKAETGDAEPAAQVLAAPCSVLCQDGTMKPRPSGRVAAAPPHQPPRVVWSGSMA